MSGCSSPSDVPGAQFVGIYDAYAVVTIQDAMGHSIGTIMSNTPTQVFHGTQYALVVDDGMCLLPLDLASDGNSATLHLPFHCSRMVTLPAAGSGSVMLTFEAGNATINTAGDLTFTANGSFIFMPDAMQDGGTSGLPGMGTFSITTSGSRQ